MVNAIVFLSLKHLGKLYQWTALLLFVLLTAVILQIWWDFAGYEFEMLWKGKLDCSSFADCFDALPEGPEAIFSLVVGNITIQAALYVIFLIGDKIYARFKKR